ncbi:MAG: AbrB family transcriptional regulator [Pseudomonadota bacterium]
MKLEAPDAARLAMLACVVAIGATGGLLASLIGTPLPWLLGAMLATAGALALGIRPFGLEMSFPQDMRTAFIAVIGVAIGGTATPDMWAEIGSWWRSLIAVAAFVVAAQAVNYQIFRRIAGYDRPTAFYCATPGGLIESVQLGEEAGGDPALLTIQHFSRIAITVTCVPILYWIMRGEAVGSAAGVSLDSAEASIRLLDVLILAGCGYIGVVGGRRIGLPAAIITGPILVSTIVHGAGMTQAQPPDWLISVAQLIVGLGLAMRFKGLDRKKLVRGLGLGALTVAAMLSLGALFALALSGIGPKTFQVLFMCFAPGGVVEMGLIALSLGVSPLIVTLHHVLRILVTVVAVPMVAKRVLPAVSPPPPD